MLKCNVKYLFILSCLYAHLTTHTVVSSVKHRVVWWGCINVSADRYVTNCQMEDVPLKSRQDFLFDEVSTPFQDNQVA